MAEEPEKTFTQDEVNQIVSERLAKESERTAKKYGDYDNLKSKVGEYEQKITDLTADLEKQKSEYESKIQANEINSVKMRIALEKGLPYDLAMRLQGTDEKSISEDADALLAYTKPTAAPVYVPEPAVPTDPMRAGLSKMLANMTE